MSNKPTTIAVATYPTMYAATIDYDNVRGAKKAGHIDHLAIAVVEKDADGELKIDRHDSSAKHLAWGGGILGAAATIAFAPLGVVLMGTMVAGTAVPAAAGGLVGHFWHNIPKDEVRELGEHLSAGDVGLMIVAVNPEASDIGALLGNARTKYVVDGISDPKGALEGAFEATDG